VSLRSELFEQPQAAQRLLETGREPLVRVAARLADRPVDFAVVAARGSSDHAAIYAQYLFGVRHRLPVALAAPSVLSLYGVEPRFERALVIGISQSGASPDVVGVVAAARRQGATTLALTNEDASALALAAEFVVPLAAGPERAIAATKTYTAELLALAMLSSAVAGDGDRQVLEQLPGWLEQALGVEDDARSIAERQAGMDRCIVLGRGFEYATAREWALKLKELTGVVADPYSAADFLHGPVALVEPGFPLLAVAPSGAAADSIWSLLRGLQDEHRAELMVLSDEPALLGLSGRGLRLPGGIPEWLRPIVSIVPAQLHAYHLAVARGRDPEAPPHLAKVTLTR
jgi:glutamine---fructose-6-phosphate transaminase (isomerizing)